MAAIYQWFVDTDVIVTTTLYPVEAQDALVFDIDLSGSSMTEMNRDKLDIGQTFLTITRTDVLITGTADPDSLDMGQTFLTITRTDVLIDATADPDSLDIGQTFLDISRSDILIRAQHPENGVYMTIGLDEAGTSLDPV